MMNISFIESQIEWLATAEDLPERLALTRHTSPPPRVSHQRLAPELTYGRHAGPPPHTARRAAVVLMLFRRRGRWHLPLTKRPMTLARHAGQISLPGGAIETNEPPLTAALRELHEELGFCEPHLVVGSLNDCYVFASDFLVTPWIIGCYEPNLHWRPNHREVEQVVELPLDVLLNDKTIGQLTVELGPLKFHSPCIRFGETHIWGATSIILSELTDLLRQLLESIE